MKSVDKEKILKDFESGEITITLTEEQAQRLYDGLGIEQSRAEYEFIKSAIEKQTPKKIKEIHCDEYYCPACGAENICDEYVVYHDYCPSCGQALECGE